MVIKYKPMNFKLLSLLIFACVFGGCENPPEIPTESTGTNLPVIKTIELKSGIENGHPVGIRISIQTTKDSDTSTTYKLISSYEIKPVGFVLVIPREVDGKQKSITAFIKSLGAPSDLFLQLLAKQYKQKISPVSKMADSIPFICMNLHNFYGTPTAAARDSAWIAAQYKLFFDSESREGDAELFMNIVPGRWIEFAEKDEDYRSHLIQVLERHQ